jgi:heme oxygenase
MPQEEAASRHLFAAPKASKRTVSEVLDETTDLHESETATVLAATHAFAIVAVGSGHRRRHHLSLDTSWKDARMPQLLNGLTTKARSTGRPSGLDHVRGFTPQAAQRLHGLALDP